MNSIPPLSTPSVTEADLQAYVDGLLPQARRLEIETYLSTRPAEAERMAAYAAQKRELRALFDPVLDEPIPARLQRAALPKRAWYQERLAAGIAIAAVSGIAGWAMHGVANERNGQNGLTAERSSNAPMLASVASTNAFVQRAAVAHAVYSPEVRRPVEVSADQEDQLIAWLSKRMSAKMKAPHLQTLGYELVGGRLLPGGSGPVAQFMYQDRAGAKLTLYVSNEGLETGAAGKETTFRFAQEGAVNVFYWIDGPFGYALSSAADKNELARVSGEVYQQIGSAVR